VEGSTESGCPHGLRLAQLGSHSTYAGGRQLPITIEEQAMGIAEEWKTNRKGLVYSVHSQLRIEIRKE